MRRPRDRNGQDRDRDVTPPGRVRERRREPAVEIQQDEEATQQPARMQRDQRGERHGEHALPNRGRSCGEGQPGEDRQQDGGTDQERADPLDGEGTERREQRHDGEPDEDARGDPPAHERVRRSRPDQGPPHHEREREQDHGSECVEHVGFLPY